MAWQHAVSLAQLHARSLATSLRSSVFFLDGVFFGGIVVVGWWLVEVFCVWWLGVDHTPTRCSPCKPPCNAIIIPSIFTTQRLQPFQQPPELPPAPRGYT